MSSYADDTKVMHRVRTIVDAEEMQLDLERIYEWAKKTNMEFNPDKFQLIRYGKNQVLRDTTRYAASNGENIEESACVKDLGVWVSSDGGFDNHIERVVRSSSHMSGWILRTFYARDHNTMKTLFRSLVLSKLDYCSPLINPSSVAMISKIERVQRAFTRKIDGMRDLNYWERLEKLKMSSVERRRERFIVIYMYKILCRLVPNPGISFKRNERTGPHAAIFVPNQNLPGYIKRVRHRSFTTIGPKLFNALPCKIRSFIAPDGANSVVLSFKTVLDNFLTLVPDQPNIDSQTNRAAGSNSLVDQIKYIQPN